MATKVVVHSNLKRLVQVILVGSLVAGALIGVREFAAWWKQTQQKPSLEEGAATERPASGVDLIVGRGSVIDADTLEIGGQRIRLEGIDAPEDAQYCTRAGLDWACGRSAASALSDWLGERDVVCSPMGEDRYWRTLAKCFVGTEDVQAWLVLSGWALAYQRYSDDYVQAQQIAEVRQAGIWEGDFVPPWDWRN